MHDLAAGLLLRHRLCIHEIGIRRQFIRHFNVHDLTLGTLGLYRCFLLADMEGLGAFRIDRTLLALLSGAIGDRAGLRLDDLVGFALCIEHGQGLLIKPLMHPHGG